MTTSRTTSKPTGSSGQPRPFRGGSAFPRTKAALDKGVATLIEFSAALIAVAIVFFAAVAVDRNFPDASQLALHIGMFAALASFPVLATMPLVVSCFPEGKKQHQARRISTITGVALLMSGAVTVGTVFILTVI